MRTTSLNVVQSPSYNPTFIRAVQSTSNAPIIITNELCGATSWIQPSRLPRRWRLTIQRHSKSASQAAISRRYSGYARLCVMCSWRQGKLDGTNGNNHTSSVQYCHSDYNAVSNSSLASLISWRTSYKNVTVRLSSSQRAFNITSAGSGRQGACPPTDKLPPLLSGCVGMPITCHSLHVFSTSLHAFWRLLSPSLKFTDYGSRDTCDAWQASPKPTHWLCQFAEKEANTEPFLSMSKH